MRKVALLGLLSVAVMANESGLYVGAELGSTRSKAKTEYDTGTTYKGTSTSMSTALDVGYYLNENSRAYVAYQYIGKGDFTARTDLYTAGYDYLFGTSALKPFVGGIIGYSTFKNNDFKVNGMAYGAQLGVDFKINNKLSVDAGYRYLTSSAEATYSGDKSTMDNFQTFFVSANYKF